MTGIQVYGLIISTFLALWIFNAQIRIVRLFGAISIPSMLHVLTGLASFGSFIMGIWTFHSTDASYWLLVGGVAIWAVGGMKFAHLEAEAVRNVKNNER